MDVLVIWMTSVSVSLAVSNSKPLPETTAGSVAPNTASSDAVVTDASPAFQRHFLDVQPGSEFQRTAVGVTGISYHVRIPPSYVSGVLRPIVIAFSARGRGDSVADAIQPATEVIGWIAVGCDGLRNGMRDRSLEVRMEDEVLNDILLKIPHDPRRVYLAGMSGGAMRSYGISCRRREEFAGILAYGGWLGGPGYAKRDYCDNMAVVMINGNRDKRANLWVPNDTAVLMKHHC